jgi:hypothetical protein
MEEIANKVSNEDMKRIKAIIESSGLKPLDKGQSHDEEVHMPDDEDDEDEDVPEPLDRRVLAQQIPIEENIGSYPIVQISIGSDGSTISASLVYPSEELREAEEEHEEVLTGHVLHQQQQQQHRDRSLENDEESQSPRTLWQKIRSIEEDSCGYVEGDAV